MTRINFDVSPELDQAIEKLVKQTGSASKSELIRRAIALMVIASEAKEKGEKVVIADRNRKPIAEILV